MGYVSKIASGTRKEKRLEKARPAKLFNQWAKTLKKLTRLAGKIIYFFSAALRN